VPVRQNDGETMLKSRAAAFLAPILLAASPAIAGTVVQTNLTSDGSVAAAFTDPNLINPWGMSYSPSGEFWVSDNGTGLTTLYDGTGKPSSLVVTIPPPAGSKATSTPTGQVYNGSSGFKITEKGNTGTSLFIFDTEDGTVSGWAPGVDSTNAVTAIDNSKAKAVYKGMAIVPVKGGDELMLANFHSGMVEIYDSNFKFVSQFRDAGLAAKYAPFNVQMVGSQIYVAYARVDKQRHDDQPGPHTGYIDVVGTDGTLVKRLVSKGKLNSPWGLALAPSSWGSLGGALLVGNFGDGTINAYDPSSGTFKGTLMTGKKTPLVIDGLWGLEIGNGGQGGSASNIYFTAGPNDESDGLYGSLSYKP
jgi:uncharacterized protein (TIGR03118 family)